MVEWRLKLRGCHNNNADTISAATVSAKAMTTRHAICECLVSLGEAKEGGCWDIGMCLQGMN